MRNTNILLNTDSYKLSHYLQYPKNTTNVFSYIEARGGKFPKTVVVGLQAFIKEYLLTPITQQDIDEAETISTNHGFSHFNRKMWEHILHKHDGLLPIKIKAVPEGSVVDIKNALVTLENTDPECAPLTSYIETALLRAIWYPTTVATLSYTIKQICKKGLEDTADTLEKLPFMLHDFGSRGVSSKESAGIGGFAHLVNFMGTDTIESLLHARDYYGVDLSDIAQMPAFSIPAAEHSTITSWGKDNESKAYENMLEVYGGEGNLLAVVSDSYDIYNACDNIWGKELKQKVIDSGAVVVVRPDSGYPPDVVLKCLQLLDKNFGHTVNSKGFKVLNNVAVLQGDGIDENIIQEIINTITNPNDMYSVENLAFGCGGKLLQDMSRDTCHFAMKCSSMDANGTQIDVFKDPVTDKGKTSKKGRLMLFKDVDGMYFTGAESDTIHHPVLETVFVDGVLIKEYSLADLRSAAE